jgi:hypothetical protein
MPYPSTDSYRNALRHMGQDYSFAPRYLRARDPHAPQSASNDIKPPEQQGYYPTGSFWTNTTNGNLWVLQKIANNLANWILLSTGSSGPMLKITGDDNVVVVPDGTGNVNLNGLVVANGTHAKAVFTESPSANTEKIDIQVSAAIASTDVTKVGLAAFNNTEFTVDGNGFVSLVGGGAAIEKVQGDDGVDVVPTAGRIKYFGSTVTNATHTKPVFFLEKAATTDTEELDVQVTTTSTNGAKSINNAGLASFDSAAFNVDAATGFISLVGGNQPAIQTLSDNAGTKVSPDSTGNIQIEGQLNEQSGSFATTVSNASGHLIKTNPMSGARWIVDPLSTTNNPNGTHTTIGSALTSATSGDTILIMPGTYTENPTLKAGVNLTAFGSDSSLTNSSNVIIAGTSTLTGAGTVTISGIQLQTNSAAILAVTGSAASIVNLNNCFLNCTNNTGITFSTSSSSAKVNVFNCNGDLGTTGIAFFAHSSAGALGFQNCSFTNSGGSSTANTQSAGTMSVLHSIMRNPITTSGTASYSLDYLYLDTSTQNVTCVTSGGSGAQGIMHCNLFSGTASAISAGTTTNLFNSQISSGNTNALTGAGTINYSANTFAGTSSKNNATLGQFNTHVGGLSFDGGTNTMAAYTVGTFTPTMVGSSTAGATTYSAQNGYYVRVGAQVQIQGVVQGSAATGTGNASFGALPFTIKNQTNGNAIGSVLMSNGAGWTWTAGTTSAAFQGTLNTATGSIFNSGTASAGASLAIANSAFNFQYTLVHEI